MISSANYKKLLKNHAKMKVIKNDKTFLNETNNNSIVRKVKIKRCKEKINSINEKINNCESKKDLVTLNMDLKKENTKLKILTGEI